MHFAKIADMQKYHNFWKPVNFADIAGFNITKNDV